MNKLPFIIHGRTAKGRVSSLVLITRQDSAISLGLVKNAVFLEFVGSTKKCGKK